MMHHKKIIRITLLSIALIITGALSVSISRGLFQDQETTGANISLGTLNLQVGDSDPAIASLDFDGMNPGTEKEYSLNLVNTGQVQGNFWMEGVVLSSTEGINSEAETDTTEPGDLDACARMTIEVDDMHGDTITLASAVYLKDMNQTFEMLSGTTVDEAVNYGPAAMRVIVDTYECGSDAMGDTVQMNLEFHLDQAV